MPQAIPPYSEAELKALLDHLKKHTVYPYRCRRRKTMSAGNFATADGSLGSYFTVTFTPESTIGIVSLACNIIITPNTAVGQFAVAVSYSSTFSLQDGSSSPDEENASIYTIETNGGAINDFQVFYPLNWYVTAGQSVYLHFWADAATITTGTAVMGAKVVLGAIRTGVRI